VNRPAIAVAAATAGETRWVRPPLPWRPSKLRFDVDAHRSPGDSLSGFMARHIEHPASSRQSKPAATKTRSRPSASDAAFTAIEPGTTIARRPSRTRRPRTTAAAARRSSTREFVHEPMNTVSTSTSRMGVPALSPMYPSARRADSRSDGSAKESGSGTTSSIVVV
jgi:ribosomal protein S12 methylthiotransferase accessory factor YcaO